MRLRDLTLDCNRILIWLLRQTDEVFANFWLWYVCLSALRLRELLLRAGLPESLYKLLTGFITIKDLSALCASPDAQHDALIRNILQLLLVT